MVRVDCPCQTLTATGVSHPNLALFISSLPGSSFEIEFALITKVVVRLLLSNGAVDWADPVACRSVAAAGLVVRAACLGETVTATGVPTFHTELALSMSSFTGAWFVI
jgi:hypothetical protein